LLETVLLISSTIERADYPSARVKSMFDLGGRIGLGAALAVVLVLGLGTGLNAFVPNNSSSTTQTVTVTSLPSTSIDCNPAVLYHGTTWYIVYSLTDGSIQTLGSPCGASILPAGVGALDVTSSPMLPIMLANGWVNTFYVNLQTQQITQIPGVTFSSNYSEAFYNGQPIINGTRLPTPYTSPSTTISNIPTCVYLNGAIHVAYPPVASGPIYLKVVTEQGSVVTNGTVYASQRLSSSDWQGSADYCLAMSYDTNSTGYMQVGAPADVEYGGDGLSLYGGVYNYTVIAQYGANQSSRVAIPDIVVQPNATTYVTILVPSGQVTTTTCSQGNSCTTTTETRSATGV
jgi:hypothetical protein